MQHWLEQHWPLLEVADDLIASKTGDLTAGFEILLPEIFSLSAEEYSAIHDSWVKAIRVLPPGTTLHKQDWFTETLFQSRGQSKAGKRIEDKRSSTLLSQCSDQFFKGRPYLHHRCHLYLTRRSSSRKNTTSASSSLLRRHLAPVELVQPRVKEEFLQIVGQFRRILDDAGLLRCRSLTTSDLMSDPIRAGLIEQYAFLLDGPELLVREPAFRDGLKIGNLFCQYYTLAHPSDLPGECSPRATYERYSSDQSKFPVGFASPVGQLLNGNHLYNQYLVIGDAQKTIKELESRRLRLQSLSAYSRENAIARDAVNDFLNESVSQNRLPVKAHFNVLVWTPDRHQLKDLRSRVGAAFAQMDCTAKEEVDGAAQLYWAGLPGNAGDFPMNDAFDSFAEQATCFFNVESGYRSSEGPVALRLGERLFGKPVSVDISDEPMSSGWITNRNKFILGPSGSGKSFFTNHMVRTYLEAGTHVVIVDVGHSYQGLCQLAKGYYFTYEDQHPIRFNPFHIGEGDTLDTEKRESIKTLLLALWKKDNEHFNRSEYVALSNALTLYYCKLQGDPHLFACFNSFYEFLRDEFTQVLLRDQVKDKDFDVSNFLYVLRPFYRGGEFDYLLNAEQNLDLLQQPFIVFELDNIKDHPILFPVVTLIIMEVFISKMRKLKGIRKMILIEEAWKAIAKEGMAEYIKYLFKTVRKFFGEAIVVTQEVEDIISSPVVKQSIINNSDTKILLDQSKFQNKFHQIQDLLGLTEKEKALVLSINKANDPTKKYKEVFISLGGVRSKVYRTEVSPEEYLVYTTEEKEKMKVAEYTKKYGNLEKAIRQLGYEIKISQRSNL